MASESNAIHLLAGGIGGTTGAVITCPLEVVKTRLQSSIATFQAPQVFVSNVAYVPQTHIVSANFCTACVSKRTQETVISTASQPRSTTNLLKCLRFIIQHEGGRALFKGLGPNLVGVAPSRAIYFCAYAQTKQFCNSVMIPETPLVHICSAASAGFTASTATNPIWYIKTRLQLDQRRHGSLTVVQCIRNTYNTLGIPGFYKGITASYFGITETVIHFVIYEGIKAKLREMKGQDIDDDRCAMDFLEFMGAGAVSKTVATIVAYPHEVARTRLRQEGSRYRGFFQTLGLVFREEGMHGLYRGLTTQLVRQIPNTAIMMSTYEAVVYLFSKY